MTKNGISSSALGVRGVEDLGGGMKASFHLEGDLDPDTGTPGGLNFMRRSTVSLMGGFGEIRMGRDYTPTFWNHTSFDPFGTNGVGSSINIFGAPGAGGMDVGAGAFSSTTVRSNNSIGYFLPSNLGGIYGQVMVGIKESTASNSASEYAGGRVGYANGPLNFAIAYAREGCATAATSASTGAITAAEAAILCGPLVKNPKRWNIGGSYNFGTVNLMLNHTDVSLRAGTIKVEAANTMVGAIMPIGAARIKASYTRYNEKDSKDDANQIALGTDYALSKRTMLYGTFARITNKGESNFGLTPNGAAPAAGKASRGIEVGVRHAF